MKIIHSFTMRVLMIMVSLLLLFCAVSTIAWYRSFTQEAVETAEEHMDTVIETLNEMFDEKLREIDYTTAFISNKVRTTQYYSVPDGFGTEYAGCVQTVGTELFI